jgi:uncharacterized protein with von Willebrand factor type A (vWA) domain
MLFRYSEWDGSQSVEPLTPEDLLDALSQDLLEEGDLRSAMERLLMRGMRRRGGERSQGVRSLMDRLRERREQQASRYDLGSFMNDIGEKLQDIIDQEQAGIDRLHDSANDASAEQSMRDLARQMADRKQQTLDNLPEDAAGRLKDLMDYEFLDPQAREAFQELVNDLRQSMLGDQFRNLQQGLERMTAEDLEPIKEMIRDLNLLLAKHVRGGASEADFREFMAKWGHMYPDNIQTIEDLVDYLAQQAEQMASLLMSMPEEMRRQIEETMAALMQDENLQYDLMEMADLIEQISGRPLGRRHPFSGSEPVDLDRAMELMRGMNDIDELERELRQAMRDLDFSNVDTKLMNDVLGQEAAQALDEMRRVAEMLEEEGLATRRGNDMQLTARAVRRLGERTLRDLFAELRHDRMGQHDINTRGSSAEQVSDTKPWEFGDPFLVDIGISISNAVRRQGPGIPVQIEPGDLEVHRREAMIESSTVIALDMSRSMFTNGAFMEAKRVALALNTLIKTRFPRDHLELVVFSHFAMKLDADRLLQSDWVDWSGTNIAAALELSRRILAKRKSANQQIILITDWRPRHWGGYDMGWEMIEETLREVKHCTQSGIRINTFMMDNDPSSMGLAQAMMKINKGRVFYGAPGRVGRYVLFDYLRNKRKRI